MGESINEEVLKFKNELAEDYTLTTVFEQGPAVAYRISNFFWSLIQGVILVGAITLIFLGFRSSLIIMTVIPLSILIGIGILDMADYALQQISIAALVIALGLLVDNGIVVVENIQRFVKQGLPIKEAAIKGTSEVGYAIISSTATTLFAFLPLVFFNSGPGIFLRSLPLTVIFVLLVSLILAMTLTPMLAGRFLKPSNKTKLNFTDKRIGGFINRVYDPLLRFSLKRGWLIVAIGLLLLIGSVSLFPKIGVTFFPTADKPLLLIEVDAPRGSSIERTDKAVRFVESVLDTMTHVTSYASNTGHGNPTIYYNRVGENFKKHHGQLLVNFENWEPATFYQTLDNLRFSFSQYADARITFQELKNGPPVESAIEVRLIGDDLEELRETSYKVESIIANTEGTIDITNPLGANKTDLKIAINRGKASMMGISLADIDQVIRAGVDGLIIDEVSFDQEEYNLVLQANFSKENIPQLSKLYFSNNQGVQVPLSHVASLNFLPAIAEIRHYDTERSSSVSASLVNLDQAIPITELMMKELEKLEIPEGVTYEIGGEYEHHQESFGDLGLLLILAMLGIFAILVLQFRSWLQPLIVFAAIPMAITGSFVALFLTGWTFSFFAFVGFISLVGIVVNNSVILVDYTNQLMCNGMEKHEAIIDAAKTRFTPIMLTTITTILGLMPLTFQATNLWSPLGWTIIGGMISSTLLTLLIVPVLYNWFTKKVD
ncbi:MAG: efflux RND transporter permease subunit [Cyclobacteriaceae bacterium]